jgi:arabinofuranosyltransferase
MTQDALRRLALGALAIAFVLFAAVLVRTAWLCDDAYITFRTIENWSSGFGLRWNVAERVQSYTHPLWMLVLAGVHALTGELYWTPLLVSLVLSLAAGAILALRVAGSAGAGCAGLMLVVGSRSFVDFSSSGLEGPLVHLLLFLFVLALVQEWRAWQVGLLVSGLMLLRTDLALLCAPGVLAWLAPRGGRMDRVRGFMHGLAPLVLWHAFSLAYYGFLVPNTAYAKLNTGIESGRLAAQGLVYLGESLRFDPLTLATVAVGALATLFLGWRERMLALGGLLYLGYVVKIGGDFMSGRFLTPSFAVALALCVRALARMPEGVRLAGALVALAGGFLAPYPSLSSGADYGADRGNDFRDLRAAADAIIGEDGISDERAWHFALTGMLNVRREAGHFVLPLEGHPKYVEIQRLKHSGEKLLVTGAIGLRGFFLGPEVHFIDQNALADPLLARLSVADPEDWRISHFRRPIPCGYRESIAADANQLRDAGLARVYDALRLVTRGPLFDGARWREIWRLNTGHYADELAGYVNDEGCP